MAAEVAQQLRGCTAGEKNSRQALKIYALTSPRGIFKALFDGVLTGYS